MIALISAHSNVTFIKQHYKLNQNSTIKHSKPIDVDVLLQLYATLFGDSVGLDLLTSWQTPCSCSTPR